MYTQANYQLSEREEETFQFSPLHRLKMKRKIKKKFASSFPGGSVVKKSAYQCRRHSFHPWVGMIPWRRKWRLTNSIFSWETPWTEEPGRLQPMELQKSQTQLSNSTTTNIFLRKPLEDVSQQSVGERYGYLEYGLPTWHSGKEPACQCRTQKRHRFDP